MTEQASTEVDHQWELQDTAIFRCRACGLHSRAPASVLLRCDERQRELGRKNRGPARPGRAPVRHYERP